MLNKQMQPEQYQNKQMFPIVERAFRNDLDTLCAEYIVLNKAQNVTGETIRQALDRAKTFRYSFLATDLAGEFFRDGKFTTTDPDFACDTLFNNLTFWANSREENPLLESVKTEIYAKYFLNLFSTKSSHEAVNTLPESSAISNMSLQYEHDLLAKVMRSELEGEDSVTYILCPMHEDPKIHYAIDTERFLPFFKRLIERRGDDVILINADVHSADFILAFFESLNFKLPEHKQEILAKIATMLMTEKNNLNG